MPAVPAPKRLSPRPLSMAGILSLVAILVLFPFDWLTDVWPAYASLFDQVFRTARDHAVGHATLFLIAGGLMLLVFPALVGHPWRYAGLMALAALSQEAVQILARQAWPPSVWDARDLFFDTIGWSLALGMGWLVARSRVARG